MWCDLLSRGRLWLFAIRCLSDISLAICPSTTAGPSLSRCSATVQPLSGHSQPPFGCCSTNCRQSRPLSANGRCHSAAVPPIAATVGHCSAIIRPLTLGLFQPIAATIRLLSDYYSAATWPLSGRHLAAVRLPLFGQSPLFGHHSLLSICVHRL